MGGGQSVRSTHFQHPTAPPEDSMDDEPEEHHISISNKMGSMVCLGSGRALAIKPNSHKETFSNAVRREYEVERLVEDATMGSATSGSNSSPPRGDYKDKIFMEKLKCLDDSHSERSGLTVEDLNALAARIELRTSNMVSVEPVCAECQDRIIDCYNNTTVPADTVRCWEAIGEFTHCVQDAGAKRLRARTEREARELARRSRHVAHAREHALKDLTPAESSV